MRHIVCLAALAFAQPAIAQTPLQIPAQQQTQCVGGTVATESIDIGRAIVAVLFPPEQKDAMMRQMMITLMGQMKNSFLTSSGDQDVDALLGRWVDNLPERLMPLLGRHMVNLTEAMACAYAREFGLAELRDIRAFAFSPSGRHYLSVSTALLADPSVAAANETYLRDAKSEIEKMGGELRKEIEALQAKKNAKKP